MKKKLISLSSKIPNMVITPLNGINLEELLSYAPILDMVRVEAPRGIERAILANKDHATIMEINNTGYYIEIPYKFWRNALIACLDYYTAEEEFEKCSSIQLILTKLSDFSKIPTTIRNSNKTRNYHGPRGAKKS